MLDSAGGGLCDSRRDMDRPVAGDEGARSAGAFSGSQDGAE
jgi:hypothetical protein